MVSVSRFHNRCTHHAFLCQEIDFYYRLTSAVHSPVNVHKGICEYLIRVLLKFSLIKIMFCIENQSVVMNCKFSIS